MLFIHMYFYPIRTYTVVSNASGEHTPLVAWIAPKCNTQSRWQSYIQVILSIFLDYRSDVSQS
jgi:hypothetical protein